jgi:SRSO17 transposase
MAVGALDEAGQEKQGRSTSGVKRQYLGCAGRVANGINTVHLSYMREGTGHALIEARKEEAFVQAGKQCSGWRARWTYGAGHACAA